MSVSKWAYSPSKCEGSPCIGECDKCSKAERDEFRELIEEMEDMICDVNVNEIADHLNEESLWNWCGAWREEAKRRLEAIEEYGRRRD